MEPPEYCRWPKPPQDFPNDASRYYILASLTKTEDMEIDGKMEALRLRAEALNAAQNLLLGEYERFAHELKNFHEEVRAKIAEIEVPEDLGEEDRVNALRLKMGK